MTRRRMEWLAGVLWLAGLTGGLTGCRSSETPAASDSASASQTASDQKGQGHEGHEGHQHEGGVCEDQPSSRAAVLSRLGEAASDASPSIVRGEGEMAGMVWIPGGEFSLGATGQDSLARDDEKPAHRVRVSGFWMDETEVTNAQFSAFVKATGYQTTAERAPDWEEMRRTLPLGTPKPPASVLVAGSLVFRQPSQPIPLNNPGNWWEWTPGANWRHPQGPSSSITGKENHPVVHISWDDAVAYARWARKRLPTEAEWEWAARGGLQEAIFAWGNEPIEAGSPRANTWQGSFPDRNSLRDGFALAAPVRSFPPNGYGLYEISGNVWEWCADWYHPETYRRDAQTGVVENPKGPSSSFDPQEPGMPKRVQRGGSFLCHDSYCASYRVSARMKSSPDTGLLHSGFRCAR